MKKTSSPDSLGWDVVPEYLAECTESTCCHICLRQGLRYSHGRTTSWTEGSPDGRFWSALWVFPPAKSCWAMLSTVLFPYLPLLPPLFSSVKPIWNVNLRLVLSQRTLLPVLGVTHWNKISSYSQLQEPSLVFLQWNGTESRRCNAFRCFFRG